MASYPYTHFEGTAAWHAMLRAFEELSLNQDLHELTPREYLVGFLLHRLDEAGIDLTDDHRRPATNTRRPTS
ncbi:MAG: hypothetical protein HY873_02755 [Chloroflexi bacterium]|nr:hypothetical protein [Chloroflexota bacterium]